MDNYGVDQRQTVHRKTIHTTKTGVMCACEWCVCYPTGAHDFKVWVMIRAQQSSALMFKVSSSSPDTSQAFFKQTCFDLLSFLVHIKATFTKGNTLFYNSLYYHAQQSSLTYERVQNTPRPIKVAKIWTAKLCYIIYRNRKGLESENSFWGLTDRVPAKTVVILIDVFAAQQIEVSVCLKQAPSFSSLIVINPCCTINACISINTT